MGMYILDLLPYISTIGVATISGIASYKTALGKTRSEINQIRIQNTHDIEKIVNQHKMDIEALKEKHCLDMQSKEEEHKHLLELLEKEHEYQMNAKEKEVETTAQAEMMSGLFGSVLSMAMEEPEIKKALSAQITESIRSDQ
jgi:hypothetical protein